nr:MAG TPA: hypothetical protein [Caudoviricetes sp.]
MFNRLTIAYTPDTSSNWYYPSYLNSNILSNFNIIVFSILNYLC